MNDYNHFLEQLREGFFLQHTVEDVLLDVHGKQLMAEALWLFGTMLLMLERRLPGPARERIVIAFLRARGESSLSSLDEVAKLCRGTGAEGGKLPANYPESYFARFEVPRDIVEMVVDRLRSDDVYSLVGAAPALATRVRAPVAHPRHRRRAPQISTYPLPEHRSFALAQQASMLYVILFFAPDMLHKQRAAMREIVDKHFNDNWVITLYMGWVRAWLRMSRQHSDRRTPQSITLAHPPHLPRPCPAGGSSGPGVGALPRRVRGAEQHAAPRQRGRAV